MLKNPKSVLKTNIAYLIDRVAVNFGQPQVYGTQFFTNENGKVVPRPIAVIENIEERRKEMELESFEIYAQKMRGKYKWPEGYENPKVGRFIVST